MSNVASAAVTAAAAAVAAAAKPGSPAKVTAAAPKHAHFDSSPAEPVSEEEWTTRRNNSWQPEDLTGLQESDVSGIKDKAEVASIRSIDSATLAAAKLWNAKLKEEPAHAPVHSPSSASLAAMREIGTGESAASPALDSLPPIKPHRRSLSKGLDGLSKLSISGILRNPTGDSEHDPESAAPSPVSIRSSKSGMQRRGSTASKRVSFQALDEDADE